MKGFFRGRRVRVAREALQSRKLEDERLTLLMYHLLQSHKRTTGMAVTMGTTCSCGYWTGEERAGTTRPVGAHDNLDWHRAEILSHLMAGGIRNALDLPDSALVKIMEEG